MPCIPIDHHRLTGAILELATECTLVKRVLRAPWQRPMADEQKRACRLRRNLTELHVLLAWTRGRLHVTSSPPALPAAGWDARVHAATIADRLAPDYARVVTSEGPATAEVRP